MRYASMKRSVVRPVNWPQQWHAAGLLAADVDWRARARAAASVNAVIRGGSTQTCLPYALDRNKQRLMEWNSYEWTKTGNSRQQITRRTDAKWKDEQFQFSEMPLVVTFVEESKLPATRLFTTRYWYSKCTHTHAHIHTSCTQTHGK